MPLRNACPPFLFNALWGNRDRWGLVPDVDDACWIEWQETYVDFYEANQRGGIGTYVNDSGYSILEKIDLTGLRVLEVGPGDIRHVQFWRGRPSSYTCVDVSESMMVIAEKKLAAEDVPCNFILASRGEGLAVPDESVDIILSFFSLEHMHPLEDYLKEFHRVLRPGGRIMGAVPAEGGLAWGLGRALTSRRWFKKNTKIDPDKIICWEHPNFGDQILKMLGAVFQKGSIEYWPLKYLHSLDLNLVIKFEFKK